MRTAALLLAMRGGGACGGTCPEAALAERAPSPGDGPPSSSSPNARESVAFAAADTGQVDVLGVAVRRDGKLALDGRTVTDGELLVVVQSAVQTGAVRATITAEAQTPHRRVVEVLDLLRTAGVTRFAIDVDAPRH